jgi:hypothetical protein
MNADLQCPPRSSDFQRPVTEIPGRPGYHSASTSLLSYVDVLNISVIADDQTVDDPHEATDAMVAAFDASRVAAIAAAN